MTRVVLVGAAGRMGRAVAQALADAPGLTLKARIETQEVPVPGDGGPPWSHELSPVVDRGDVVVEFSSPAGAVAAARVCAERGAGLVSGTTGLDEAGEQAMRDAAARTAILRSANFSLGIVALRRALASVLAVLPDGWDIEIVERHHRGKQDAPSGTALLLGREAAERRGYPDVALRTGRSVRTGTRPQAEIAIHSLRGGTWTGDHSVVIAGPGEWLELRHVAEDRAAFAHGALAAARFIAAAPPGLYTLDEVSGAAAR
ncbi:MAG: 4-hydroxy-tetrahydrodipicolinate reductase [Gemmatimonadales bacterium]